MTCTLIASVIVSFTFMPLIAYYLIKPPKQLEPPMSERRQHGFPALYYRVGDFALRHRWGTFAGSLIVLVLGGVFFSMLKPQFFPKDLSYLSYVDVWLPPDAPLGATDTVTQRAETVIRPTLQRVLEVAKVQRVGVLPEEIYLEYSDARLAALKLQPTKIKDILNARNVTAPGGIVQTQSRNVLVDATAEFKSTKDIGNVLLASSPTGAPLYLRDLVDISRAYQTPTRYLNYMVSREADGNWHRNRAITLAVQMRSGEQVFKFGAAVDKALAYVRPQLPADLIVARTSDQPRQVKELVSLLMGSLYEAIVLVVIVALIGFWDWRAAMLMAASIPLTLAMTFGIVHVLGIDIQQVSIATLIIALGLLVDMPVVAGDAIKRELGSGSPRDLASWIGPTKLAKAIVFATITNIVAYLPFLMLTGDTGFFLYSLPVVMTCTLIASVIVSFTFMPLIAYYMIKPPKQLEEPMSERRKHGFPALYYRVGDFALRHRWGTFAGSLIVLVLGGVFFSNAEAAVLPQGPLLPVVRGCLASARCPAGCDGRGHTTSRNCHSARGGTIWKRTSSQRCSKVADHICRRRRPQILVLGRPRATTAQLCADPRRGFRQALHQRIRWPAADGAEPRSRGSPGRCAAARDRQAGRHSRLDSNFRSRDGSSAPSLRRSPGNLSRPAKCDPGTRRLGRTCHECPAEG